jgi:hypothetical protein
VFKTNEWKSNNVRQKTTIEATLSKEQQEEEHHRTRSSKRSNIIKGAPKAIATSNKE